MFMFAGKFYEEETIIWNPNDTTEEGAQCFKTEPRWDSGDEFPHPL